MQPVPLPAKKVEERPPLVDLMKEGKEDTGRRRQQMSKEGEEKENRVLRKEEEKENIVLRKEEKASHSWRRSVAVASRKWVANNIMKIQRKGDKGHKRFRLRYFLRPGPG